ncbi:MAG: molybdenum cofactor guanylyltransferase [Acidimicrobiales bacterium]
MTATFTGAVLCGGSSRRMGRDKATLLVDGEAMAARVARALHEAGAAAVVAIGGDPQQLGSLGLDVIPDDEPGGGPLPATITALRHGPGDVVVVLACDLVHPSADAVRLLVDRLRSSGPSTDAAVPVVAGVHQWTHVAWRRRAVHPLEAARDAGTRSLRGSAGHLTIRAVDDLGAADVADADDPFDLPGAR